jgi:phospholipase D1/2
MVLEDRHLIDSAMDGQPFKAGNLASTLRRTLWREHLGLLPAQDMDASNDPNAQPPDVCSNRVFEGEEDEFVADPLGDALWDMWRSRARKNTEIYRYLFRADPDDNSKRPPGPFHPFPRRGPCSPLPHPCSETHLPRADLHDIVKTFKDYETFLPKNDVKQGHLHDKYMPAEEAKRMLDEIKGHLVEMPLHFLENVEMAEKGLQVNAYTESIYT